MSVNNSRDVEVRDISPPASPRNLRGRAFKHLDRMDCAIRICAICVVICFIATIVLIGLAQARYVQPYIAMGTFGGCVMGFVVIQCIDCCQRALAKNNNIDLDEYYTVKQPPLKSKKNKKKKT